MGTGPAELHTLVLGLPSSPAAAASLGHGAEFSLTHLPLGVIRSSPGGQTHLVDHQVILERTSEEEGMVRIRGPILYLPGERSCAFISF